MTRILVTGGGTATAWHICSISKKYFHSEIYVVITDINDPDLVAASVLADAVYKVPCPGDSEYLVAMSKIIIDEEIDVIIPLIPIEAFIWNPDGKNVIVNGIKSTSPELRTVKTLADKRNMHRFLTSIDVDTPAIYEKNEIMPDRKYLIKPRMGFGSSGIRAGSGEMILHEADSFGEQSEYIISELCQAPDFEEITCEVYYDENRVEIFARKRIETKSGVCVKSEPVDINPFICPIRKIAAKLKLPTAFNVQFLLDNKKWKLFDCNLRLGAGTALSSSYGFQLTRALLTSILGRRPDDGLFMVDKSIRKVLRRWEEVLIR